MEQGRLAGVAVPNRRRVRLEPGFEMLLNGTDLTGWHYQNGAAVRRQGTTPATGATPPETVASW